MSYFSFREMCKTNCKEDNYPQTMEQVGNLCALVSFLDEVRAEFGEPIVVNSGYRSDIVNQKVGGVRTSLHLQGRAADIRPLYENGREYYNELQRLYEILHQRKDETSELIRYKEFIHVAI